MSPVKKRVKENSPPHQQRYNNRQSHISPLYLQNNNLSNNNLAHGNQQNLTGQQLHHQNHSTAANTDHATIINESRTARNNKTNCSNFQHSGYVGSNITSGTNGLPNVKQQQTITIHDTPSPTAVITISDSEDESPEAPATKTYTSSTAVNNNSNNTTNKSNSSHRNTTSSSTCRTSHANVNTISAHQSSQGAAPYNSQSQQYHQNQPHHNSSNHQHQYNNNVQYVNNSTNTSSNTNTNNNASGCSSARQRKNVISCVTVADSDGEEARRCPSPHVYTNAKQNAPGNTTQQHQQGQVFPSSPVVKFEPHAGLSQKKRLLAMAQNEYLVVNNIPNNSSSISHQLSVPKQEPSEFNSNYDYQNQILDKRSSWAPPAHHNHHKRESMSTYIPSQQNQPPPIAHAKNSSGSVASSWNTPIFRQHQTNTPIGNSPGCGPAAILQQDIYAQGDSMYRRPTVFVSQAPYQSYNRVIPPPAHNASSRQVILFVRNFK